MKNFKRILGVSIFLLMLTPFAVFGVVEAPKDIPGPSAVIPSPMLMQAETKTRLKNKGEEQQNAVQLQKDGQTNGQARGINQNRISDKAAQRRSRVANSVQGMLHIADQNQIVGNQIKTIAQDQNQNHEKIENEIKQVKNRGRLKKFFFGPDYKNLNSVEDRLANHEEKLGQLRQLATQIADEADAAKLLEQIEVMEQVKTELTKEVVVERKGFSLFGWLNKMLAK